MDKFNLFKAAFEILTNSTFGEFTSSIDRGILGNGLILKSLNILNNTNKYCHLYKNDKLVNKQIFRLGGMSSSFNDKPYCNLIYYGQSTSKLKDARKIDSFGEHCIIDTSGKIVFKALESFDSPYYLQGVIAVCKNKYYNLLTGKLIIEGSKTISSANYLFVEHIGVYKINWNTGEYEYFK